MACSRSGNFARESVQQLLHKEYPTAYQRDVPIGGRASGSMLPGSVWERAKLARWYGLDASEALQGTSDRFVERFALVDGKYARVELSRRESTFVELYPKRVKWVVESG